MSFSCESVARHILPLYRAFVAKELIEKYGYSQVKAARKLGTTQPAISQYISSKRGQEGIPNYEEVAPLVKKAAAEAAEHLATTGMTREEFSVSFCDLCKELQMTEKVSAVQARGKS
jgi:predicted transcriptional regulator